MVLLLLLAARLTRGRYAARWRCTAWLLLSLRLAVPFPLLPHMGPAEAPVQLTVPSNPVVFTYSPPVTQPPAATRPPSPPPLSGRGWPGPQPPRCLPSIFHRSPIPPNHLTPQPTCRPPPKFVPAHHQHPHINLAQTSTANFVEKIKKLRKEKNSLKNNWQI